MAQKELSNILLVIPDNPVTTKFQMMTAGITPPLGVGYIASYLLREKFNVAILDNSISHLNETEFINYLKRFNPDIVGLTALTYAVGNVLNLAGIVKNFNHKITVVVGGAHAAALPNQMLQYDSIDIVVTGEGEVVFFDLILALSNHCALDSVDGIVFKKNGYPVATKPRPLIEDISSLPFPAYELMPMSKYFLPSTRRFTSAKIGSIVTMRGCPFQCIFCSSHVFGRSVRYRNPQNVVDEVALLLNKYRIGELVVWDDNFNLHQGRAIEICRLIQRKNLKITWSCNNRADLFSEEICQAFYEAGCRQVNFGIESGDQIMRDVLKKDISEQHIEKAIRLCRKYKLRTSCSFIFGVPGETWETALKTLRFAKQLNPDYVMFCVLVPMPGSELFEYAREKGFIDVTKERWDRYVTLLSAVAPVVSM